MAACTLNLLPLMILTISRAFSDGIPFWSVTFWRAVPPRAFSTSPNVNAFRGTLRLTRRSSSTVRTALILDSSPVVRISSSPWMMMSDRVLFRSKRVVISFMACPMAFFTSCMSTSLTTSKELSATGT